jgi:hypothetical protein
MQRHDNHLRVYFMNIYLLWLEHRVEMAGEPRELLRWVAMKRSTILEVAQ